MKLMALFLGITSKSVGPNLFILFAMLNCIQKHSQVGSKLGLVCTTWTLEGDVFANVSCAVRRSLANMGNAKEIIPPIPISVLSKSPRDIAGKFASTVELLGLAWRHHFVHSRISEHCLESTLDYFPRWIGLKLACEVSESDQSPYGKDQKYIFGINENTILHCGDFFPLLSNGQWDICEGKFFDTRVYY